MNIAIHETLLEASYDDGSRLLSGVILAAGMSKNGNFYPAETIERAADKFRGVKCFIDHSADGNPGGRSIRDVCGIVEECRAESGKLKALIRLSAEHAWIDSMIHEGILGDVSINALGRTKLTRRDGRVVREVTEISKAYSVDFVTDAAAGGRVEALLRESAGYAEGLRLIESMTLTELKQTRPDLVNRILDERVAENKEVGGTEIPREASSDETAILPEAPAEESATVTDELQSATESVIAANETERRVIVENVLASRKLQPDVSQYLREKLSRYAFTADGITNQGVIEENLNKLVEDHLAYLGRLADSGAIRSVTFSDPLDGNSGSGRTTNGKASTFRFLGIR